MHNPAEQFRDAIRAAGLNPPESIEADGKLRRFPTNGRSGDDSGWYVLHSDGAAAGAFGDWRSGFSGTWRGESGHKLTPGERAAQHARIEAARRAADAERERSRTEAADRAAGIWKSALPVPADHSYVTRKGIQAHGVRLHQSALVIPMRDADGILHSLQFIGPDGDKRYLSGGRVKGCYFGIGKPDGVLCIAEGYATGATIHEATGYAVAIAFDCGNLEPVTKALRAKYPDMKLVLCADDDMNTAGNPGKTKAIETAQAVGGYVALPDFGAERPEGATDFNDLAEFRGTDAVKLAIERAQLVRPETPDTGVTLIRGSEINPAPIQWLWDGYLAQGKLHILAGAPGTGKTTIALALAATVTTGGRWPDGTRCTPGNVLIWSGEDDANDTLLPRLLAMGADRSRVYFVGTVRMNGEILPFDPAHHLRELTEAAANIGDVRLLIVDPIVNAVLGDSHKSTEVRRALQPIVDLAASLNAAALGISHFSKGTQGRDPVERITGSVAFGALPRIVFAAAKDQDDGRILVRTKSNIGPDGGGFKYDLEQIELREVPGLFASRVLWGNALEGSAKELLAVAEVDQDATDRTVTAEVTDWLQALIEEEGGEIDKRDVIKLGRENGFSERTIYRARDSLQCKIRTTGFGKEKRSKWSLPTKPVNPANFANPANSATLQNLGKNGRNGDEGGVEI